MDMFDALKLMFKPARRKRFPRERFILPKEWDILRPIIQRKPDIIRIYFSLLFLLGPRKSELRTARWVEIDLDAGIWHKTKTKNGRRQIIPLPPAAVDLLRQLPQTGPYLFSGRIDKGGNPNKPWSRTAVTHQWRKIRWEAGCPDVQIRDIRRTAATWMVQGGENLMTIKEILNHSSVAITQVYARADSATQLAALSRHSQRVMGSPSNGGLTSLLMCALCLT